MLCVFGILISCPIVEAYTIHGWELDSSLTHAGSVAGLGEHLIHSCWETFWHYTFLLSLKVLGFVLLGFVCLLISVGLLFVCFSYTYIWGFFVWFGCLILVVVSWFSWFGLGFVFFFLSHLSQMRTLRKTGNSLGVGVKVWAWKHPSLTDIYTFLYHCLS